MEGKTYFSIYIPSQQQQNVENEDDDDLKVFVEKEEALKVLKSNKDGRLKSFKSKDDADNYARTGQENVLSKFPHLKSPSATVEKAAFHAPSKTERMDFRKAIEQGDFEKVKKIIWENPRYLINVGDTPTSLKEGYRYNALHICAIHKRPEIADLILQTINTIAFVELLHGKKNLKVCQEVCEILLDYYLNMPEKGRSETPLHLAVKYGAVEVVEVLTKWPQCKMVPNLENLLPKDIICDRLSDAPVALKEKIANLLEERFYVPVIRSVDGTVPPHVGQPFSPSKPPELNIDPLSPELEIQAYAGPMSKDQANKFRRRWKTPPRSATNNAHNLSMSPSSSSQTSSLIYTPKKLFNVLRRDNSCLTPRSLFNQEIKNGTSDDIEKLNKSIKNESSLEEKSSNHEQNNNENGLQKTDDIINPILPMISTPTKSYPLLNRGPQFNNIFALTPLLKKNPAKKDVFYTYREQNIADSPIALMNDGGELNDSTVSNVTNQSISLSNSTIIDSPVLKHGFIREMHLKLSDTEKGLELVGRELAKEQNVEWKEYWDFLSTFIDIASPEGLTKFEEYLEKKKIKKEPQSKLENGHNQEDKEKKGIYKDDDYDTLCNELQKCMFKDKQNVVNNKNLYNNVISTANKLNFYNNINGSNNRTQQQQQGSGTATTTPYLCVEKSLQVFAKRCTKTILNNIKNVISINDAFLSELKRLKSLISSFKDDQRFFTVNFEHVHSRFATLIVSYLKNSQEIDNETIYEIQQCFQQIIQSRMKILDKETGGQNSAPNFNDKKEQLQCVAGFILKYLIDQEQKILPENLKTEKICSETWSNEFTCSCQWETVLSRQASRKKRHDSQNNNNNNNNDKNLTSENKSINSSETNSIDTGNNVSNSINPHQWRKPQNDSISSDESTNESDEDVFYSDLESDIDDDENFYTPPQSPIMFDEKTADDDELDGYENYLFGNEPTKRDLDVLNAIFHLDIDKEKYPNIYLWRAAVLKHPNEERDNFPSPAIIVKTSKRHLSNNNKIVKGLFGTIKPLNSPKLNRFPYKLFTNNLNSGGSSDGESSKNSDYNSGGSSTGEIDSPPIITDIKFGKPTTPTDILENNLSFLNVSDCS